MYLACDLTRRDTAADAERIDLVGFLIHSVVAQLNCATASDSDDFDAVVVEIKRLLVSYLFAIAGHWGS
ncbi:hypothetical protein [uncultured Corynebacterium sp.]|uniref:hypothetical protein n=1 Tax=uncultured Corynebacterium sp. TaxID=159447 RepID=UPI00262B5A41|nr:hypothetical protein [uncultured Corynebacterium sp.]